MTKFFLLAGVIKTMETLKLFFVLTSYRILTVNHPLKKLSNMLSKALQYSTIVQNIQMISNHAVALKTWRDLIFMKHNAK